MATRFRPCNIPLLRSLVLFSRDFYKHTAPNGAMIMSDKPEHQSPAWMAETHSGASFQSSILDSFSQFRLFPSDESLGYFQFVLRTVKEQPHQDTR